jgi:hypothetical protein
LVDRWRISEDRLFHRSALKFAGLESIHFVSLL